MASTQVPVNTVADPADLMASVAFTSPRAAVNDVQGQASTVPTPQMTEHGRRVIRP
jgi:hypothetical protein